MIIFDTEMETVEGFLGIDTSPTNITELLFYHGRYFWRIKRLGIFNIKTFE